MVDLKGSAVAGAVFLGEVAPGAKAIPELTSKLIDMQTDLLKAYAANKGVNLEAGAGLEAENQKKFNP